MENPIPTDVRGWLYVAAIVTGGLALVASAVLTVLGYDAWQVVVTAIVSSTSIIAGGLGRSNLSIDESQEF